MADTVDNIQENENAKPWDKRPDESKAAYQAFLDYCRMGKARSIRDLTGIYREQAQANVIARPPSIRLSTVFGWSLKYSWQARVKAWDEQQDKEESEKWLARRDEHRERAWKLSGDLLEKAEQMLKFPVYEVETIQGGQVQIIKPGKWNLRDAAMMVETADKVARLAAELATDRQVIESNDSLNDADRVAKILTILQKAEQKAKDSPDNDTDTTDTTDTDSA